MRPASPMTMPRTSKAVRDRPGVQARLLPNPFPPPGIMPLTTHNKRCPKAQRLGLRSDLSPSRPSYGRSPDKTRHALRKGRCQVCAPLTGRKVLAAPGDAPEHGVMSLHRAIAPYPDSPAVYLAGESEQSDERRLKTNAPFLDSTVAYLAGESEQSDERRLKTNAPYLDSTVVTTGKFRSTNGGHGSPLPSLGMVEHFRWTGLPQSEDCFSRLVRILSEVWGCRRVVADANRPQGRTSRIAIGVFDFMRNRPAPSTSTSFSSAIPSLTPGIELEAEAGILAPTSASVLLSPSPLMKPSHNCHPRTLRGIWGNALSSTPSPLGKDISKMHCIFDMSIKQGGRVGLPLIPGRGREGFLLPSTKLETLTCAMAQVSVSVFSSPSPLMALRERGIKGERVFPFHFLKQSKPCLNPQNNQTHHLMDATFHLC